MTKSLKSRVRRLLPRSMRAHTILAGPLRGARIYTSWHDYPGAILGTTERPLLDWFARNVLRGETWIDIGAHYGYTAIALCRLTGPAGRVFSFEPVLATAGCVARTRELNRLSQLRVAPLGLGADRVLETRRLPLVRGMADSTVARNIWEEPISLVSFDAIWPVLCEQNAALHGVKIDVQGMELEVIEGMRRMLLSQHPKLIVEFHCGVDRSRAVELLASCGYTQPGAPIDPAPSGSSYQDDKSYVFVNPCAAVSAS
ncbi:MAG TPA: FkbM family methyltransferase [Bryobacteraceae bacterium]|nr:FkbM family methyltransferase [Bryobacteraceae bacterium]